MTSNDVIPILRLTTRTHLPQTQTKCHAKPPHHKLRRACSFGRRNTSASKMNDFLFHFRVCSHDTQNPSKARVVLKGFKRPRPFLYGIIFLTSGGRGRGGIPFSRGTFSHRKGRMGLGGRNPGNPGNPDRNAILKVL